MNQGIAAMGETRIKTSRVYEQSLVQDARPSSEVTYASLP